MKSYIRLLFAGILLLLLGFLAGKFSSANIPEVESPPTLDLTDKASWDSVFRVVEIRSPIDSQIQLAYYLKTSSKVSRPLLVSLHSWSADYTQLDPLAELASNHDWNYIHPDFRGPNWTPSACCSHLALADMDAAVDYAVSNGSVDVKNIFVVGSSGGGYATLAMFMKSKHTIRKFSAWVPISDLASWYQESGIRNNKYAQNILDCTGSKDSILDIVEAQNRSPIYWSTPTGKIPNTKLEIFTGIYDGIQGSVPITQSINFYNKVVRDSQVGNWEKLVTDKEKLDLLEKRKPLGNFGLIDGRTVLLRKETDNIGLVIFEGNHEMLTKYAFESLRSDTK